MNCFRNISTSRVACILLGALCCSSLARAQSTAAQTNSLQTDVNSPAAVLHALDQVVEQNRQLEKQNQQLMDQIESLRQVLATQASSTDATRTETAPPTEPPAPVERSQPSNKQQTQADSTAAAEEKWGDYTPNFGYKVANTDRGDLNISIYSYGRYLNQLGLDSTYTDAFGNIKNVQQRQDFQLQKVQIKFLGWMFDPKFRYFLYAWTSNPSQGLPAQVVVAGNLNYTFKNWFSVGAGIRSLPGTRSVEGNFPFWLGVDSRLMADEFFRPSYTSGVWTSGKITDKLDYIAMIGNNLSTLGVSAAQLDNGFNTISTSLVWKPTMGEFGPGSGDFEHHEKLAARLGAHFTYSEESKQSQPNSEGFENTQLRLSDGSVIFTPNLFGPGITITNATDRMTSLDAGLKYRGLSL